MAKVLPRNPVRIVKPYQVPTMTTVGPARDREPERSAPVRRALPAPPTVDGHEANADGPTLRQQVDAVRLAERVRAALLDAGIRPAEAARRMGWPRSRMTELLNGRGNPGFIRLIGVVSTLGLDWRIVLPEAFE